MRRVSVGLLWLVMALGLSACNDTTLAPGPPDLEKPVAVIAGVNSSATLSTVSFDGLGSYDPDNSDSDAIVDYQWSLVTPPGSSSTLQGSGTNVSLFVDVAGPYEITLVVTDQDGLQSDPETFVMDGLATEDIHVELSWDKDIVDVDVHLVHLTGGGVLFSQDKDCFFANCVPGFGSVDWGPAGPSGNPTLDLDEVEGYGPENINIEQPETGVSYKVTIHYWSDDGLGSTTATARIYISGQLVYEQAQLLSATGKTWDVAQIDWPNSSVTPLGTMYDCDPITVSFGGTC